MKKYSFLNIKTVFFYIVLLLCMFLFQLRLDPKRHISYHCLIRNFTILTVILLVISKKINILTCVMIVLGLEIVIEVFHQLGYTLDPYDYKVINFYRWADTLWNSKTVKIMDTYTEGKHDGNAHIHVKDTIKPKFKWMADNCLADASSSILEIGCGNGEFLEYLKNDVKCKRIVGVTLSPEQSKYLKNKGFEIILTSIWDLPPSYFHQFDSIVLNGSTEHFLNTTDCGETKNNKYLEMFEIIKKCIDPNSKKQRIVITCIHMHRPLAPFERFQTYLLDRTYGGNYPRNMNSYIDYAKEKGLKVIKQENRTMDYYIWARKIWFNVFLGLREPNTLFNAIIDIPVFTLNDPYYPQKVLHILFQTWPFQFDVPYYPWPISYDDTPMTYHQWLVFSGITSG